MIDNWMKNKLFNGYQYDLDSLAPFVDRDRTYLMIEVMTTYLILLNILIDYLKLIFGNDLSDECLLRWALMINIFMHNKKTKKGGLSTAEQLSLIYQQITKNKEQLQTFYSKNKMKFPPILQSRNILLRHFSPDTTLNPPIFQSIRQEESDAVAEVPKLLHKKPSICKIIFSKGKKRPRQDLALHSSRMLSHQSKGNIFKTLGHTPQIIRTPRQAKNLSFLSSQNTKTSPVDYLLQKMSNQKKEYNVVSLSQSIDAGRVGFERPFEINQMNTLNPQIQLIKTLRGKGMSFEAKTGPSQTRQDRYLRQISRLSFYKNADGILSPKKGNQSKRREGSTFQPWQPLTLMQQDFFGELNK